MPFLWKGGCILKFQTILSFSLLFLAKAIAVSKTIHTQQVTSPLILKVVIDKIAVKESAYDYIILFAVTRFLSEFINNMKEVAFANVAANAEAYIADDVSPMVKVV